MQNDNLNNVDPSSMSEEELREAEKNRQAQNKAKTLKAAGEVASSAYFGPGGGLVFKALADTKPGEKILENATKRMPNDAIISPAAEKLGESGYADEVANLVGKKMGAIPEGGAPLENEIPKTPDSDIKVPQAGSEELSEEDKVKSGVLGASKAPSFLDDEEEKATFEMETRGTVFVQKVVKFFFIASAVSFPFLLIGLVLILVVPNVARFSDAFGINSVSGGSTGDIVYVSDNKDAQEFYERVNNIKLDYQKAGKTVDAFKVVAVYNIISQYDGKVTYKKMTNSKIKKIVNSMFNGNYYDEELFKKNLKDDIFKDYFPKYEEPQRERLVEEVFEYINDYYEFIGEEPPKEASCSGGGTCNYNIKGFYISGRGNVSKQMNITNLKVRLMQCSGRYGRGTWGMPLDEQLVDFEKYVMGVAYQEMGPDQPDEALKAQMIASRSFALSRPTAMNNSLGKKLAQEKNQWILQMASCVADQVYCDPDKGCSAMNDGEQYGTVRSGTSYSKLLKYPLADNHKMRTLAKLVEGEVLVNSQGNIISTSYTNVETNKFIALAKKGLNYKQILLTVYNNDKKVGASDIQKMNCGNSINCNATSNGVTGEYSTWSQKRGSWINIPLGSSKATIYNAGCLVTSVAMLIAKSGVATNVNGEFNPGSFVQMLNQVGGFDAHGNFQWTVVSKVAPNFQYIGKKFVINYSRQQKLATLTELLNNGYYVVAEVKGNTGQHWVAVNSVTNNVINMMDPSSSSTDMWAQYPWYNTSQFAYFKVVK